MDDWQMPTGHPISIEKAKALMVGPLADVYRSILMASCAPIFWYRKSRMDRSILHNATLTFARTPQCLLGITAAHVVRAYLADSEHADIVVQIGDADVNDMESRIICLPRPGGTDIATIRLDDAILNRLAWISTAR